MTESLLTTKLYIPRPVPNLVPRPRLSKQLEEGIGRKLTLISAPAGFGKTTLLSEWRMTRPGRKWPVGWISLDEGDNDPVLFFSYLVAALRAVQADIGEAPLALLQSPQGPPLRSVLTILLNELAAIPKHFVLVLDDYHVIENRTIHEAIAFLLDHLPPQMHLIISSRTEPPLPLARLRARSDLAELRPADLRFESEEVVTFLNGMVGFDLSADDVTALDERTEGWIAGLQLVALSLQGEGDILGFIDEFTGTHRYILDYLAEEVLHRQPEDVRDFLLRTAILDLLSGPLCDALTGRSDSQQKLEELEQANLFLVPLDNRRRWYRYHHLFSDFLRERLRRVRPDLTPGLHRTASHWYEQNGLMAEAVDHAIAAGAFERAAVLVDRIAEGMLRQGRLSTLAGWVDALPQRMAYVRPRPYLFHAETLFLLGRYEAAEANLQTVEQALGGNGGASETPWDNHGEPPKSGRERTELRGMVSAIRASIASVYGDLPRTVTLSQRALRHLPENALVWRGNTLAQLGVAYALNGDMKAASRTFAEADAINERADNTYAIQIVTWRSARLQVAQGRLRQAADVYRQVLLQASEQVALGQLPVTGYCYLDLGDLLREWNDLAAAARHLEAGIERVERAGSPTILLDGYIALARLRQAFEDEEGTLRAFRQAQSLVRRHVLPLRFVARLAAYEARFWLAQGDLEAAMRWGQDKDLDPGELGYLREVEHLTMARVFVAQGRLAEAQHLLERLLSAAEGGGRMKSAIEILILQAVAFQAQRDEARALGALESALELAQPEGYVRTFVDEGATVANLLVQARNPHGERPEATPRSDRWSYADKLLAAFGRPPAPRRPLPEALPGIDLLSDRELEVLRLVAVGFKNQQIADKLFVVVGTVKAHLNSIYRKLGVQSRTQAVARARDLGLLDGNG